MAGDLATDDAGKAAQKASIQDSIASSIGLESVSQIHNFVLRAGSIVARFNLLQRSENSRAPSDLFNQLLAAANSGSLALPGGFLGIETEVSALRISQLQNLTALGGVPFSRQPTVELIDAAGRIVPETGTLVTASLQNSPQVQPFITPPSVRMPFLNGTLVVASVNGTVTFTDLSVDVASNTSYVLSFQAGSFSVSTFVSVSVGTASKLKVFRPPSAVLPKKPWKVQPIVCFVDLGDNIVPIADDITLSSNASLTPQVNVVRSVNGVASFFVLSVASAGLYQLEFISAAFGFKVTIPLNVPQPVPSAIQISSNPVFPPFSDVGSIINVVIRFVDSSGVVTPVNNQVFATLNTLSLPRCCASVLTPSLLGNTRVEAVDGIAIFNTLSFSTRGNFSITFRDVTGNLGAITSPPVVVKEVFSGSQIFLTPNAGFVCSEYSAAICVFWNSRHCHSCCS